MASWLVKEEITIYNSVASLFRHFVSTLTGAESFPSVRLIRLGGEPVFGRDVKSYKKHFSNDCIMINMLGLNEAGGPQVYFIDKESPSQDGVVPVGYPSGEGRILLLDDAETESASIKSGKSRSKVNIFLAIGEGQSSMKLLSVLAHEAGRNAFFAREILVACFRMGVLCILDVMSLTLRSEAIAWKSSRSKRL